MNIPHAYCVSCEFMTESVCMFLFISLHLMGSTVATELIKTLRQITSSLIVNNDFQGESLNASSRAPQSVNIPAASTVAAPAVAVPPQHASSAVLPPQPAVVPAQKMEPPRQEEVTPASIVRDFGSSALRETAFRHASLLRFYLVVSIRAFMQHAPHAPYDSFGAPQECARAPAEGW